MKLTYKHILMSAMFALAGFAVQAQVKIGSNPTSINAANNLEVEASTARGGS